MPKKLKKKPLPILFFLLLLMGSIALLPYMEIRADEPYVIVIDPGHGGEKLGAEHDGYTEKEMTMAVARAMKEELEHYENVVVYLTHENDEDMSIKDRAVFARKKNADYLFSLHFNASVNHNLYGAEVWVPAYGDFYVSGHQFAEIEMQLLTGKGLYSRGIKTRLNNVDKDYYGILRYCSAEGVPSVLIEHCHMDHPIDQPFFQTSDDPFTEFGKLDAEAVAKFLGLSSASLLVDYSEYPLVNVDRPKDGEPVRPDKSMPEISNIEVLSIQEGTGEVTIRMKASDSDSYIQYYSYSIDGGDTYSELCKWPRPFWNQSDEELVFTITVPLEQEIELIARAYNGYDGFTESNVVNILPIMSAKEVMATYDTNETYEEISFEQISDKKADASSALKQNDKVQLLLLILIISFLMTWILFVMLRMISLLKKDSKRRRRR